MKRDAYLTAALKTCTQDRQNVHGEPEDSFSMWVDLVEMYLAHKYNIDLPLAAEDGAVMLALLKITRFAQNARHSDNMIDGAAYLAIAGELADRMSDRVQSFKAEAMAA